MDSPVADRVKHSRKPVTDGRRSKRRFPIVLDARWKCPQANLGGDRGTGTTIDVSSRGVLIHADRELSTGLRIELSIAWPVLLRNVAPLQLRVRGEIVRVVGRTAAIHFGHYEFRTVAMIRTLDQASEGRGRIAVSPEA